MAQNFVIMNEAGIVGAVRGDLSRGGARGDSSSFGMRGGRGRGQEKGRGGRGPRNISEWRCFKCNGLGHLARSCTGGGLPVGGTPVRGGALVGATLTGRLTRKRTRSGETGLAGSGQETTSQKWFAWGDEK